MQIKSRPNPNKRDPSLSHLRNLAEDALLAPEPEPSRYEAELTKYLREQTIPYLKPATDRKPERIGSIRI
jgi:hypothetical protein